MLERKGTAVAGRENVGVRGAKPLIDGDTVVDNKAGSLGQCRIRHGSDADHGQIRDENVSVGKLDFHPLLAFFDAQYPHVAADIDAFQTMPLGNDGSDFVRHAAG
ncbi:hypothetical protein D9M72_568320 [compost metagenome]